MASGFTRPDSSMLSRAGLNKLAGAAKAGKADFRTYAKGGVSKLASVQPASGSKVKKV